MHDNPQVLRHPAQGWLKLAGLIGAGLALAILGVGLVSRALAGRELSAATAQNTLPIVRLVRPVLSESDQSLVLPGVFQAFNDAQIHSRVSGYLKDWRTDIGARVKAGQVLADIDTPELDQQRVQAEANLATARSTLALARTTAARWNSLLADDAVSKQEADERSADLGAKTSLAQAAQAEVGRLKVLQSFKHIVAPFDGVVTGRTTDIGALIAAGAPNDPGLFTVADDHRLRLYVRAPQSFSSGFKVGDEGTVTVPEYPGRRFTARLTSMTGAVSDQSGAMLIELQIDNAARTLKPGDYAQVRFNLPKRTDLLRLPASAITFRHGGMAVAVVGRSGQVELRNITVVRDLGGSVEVAGGVAWTDRIIKNPPDSIATGDSVRIAPDGEASHGQSQPG